MASWNWITDRIALGPEPGASEVRAMQQQGITDVLDLRGEPRQGESATPGKYAGSGIDYHYLPMLDRGIVATTQAGATSKYQQGISVMRSALAKPGKVLVHCFPPGTLIDCGGVFTPIEEINRASVVTSHAGGARRVVEPMARRYDGDLVKINVVGSMPVRCTPEHPLLVLRPYRSLAGKPMKPNWSFCKNSSTIKKYYDSVDPEWVEAKDIKLGDFLLTPLPSMVRSDPCGVLLPTVLTHKNAKELPERIWPSRDMAWLMGLYAADGSSQGDHVFGLTLSVLDDVERAEKSIRLLGVEPITKKHKTFTRVKANSTALTSSLRQWFGRSSHEKRLPSFLFDGSWDMEALLEGLIDGDGNRTRNNGWEFRTTSLVLAMQVRFISLCLGMNPSMTLFRRKSGFKNARPMYTVRACESVQHQTFRWRGFYCMPASKIELEKYVGDVHNFEVDVDNSYIANGVAVHNCAAGISRSPSMVYAYLLSTGMSPTSAWNTIHSHRSVASQQYFRFAEAAVLGRPNTTPAPDGTPQPQPTPDSLPAKTEQNVPATAGVSFTPSNVFAGVLILGGAVSIWMWAQKRR